MPTPRLLVPLALAVALTASLLPGCSSTGRGVSASAINQDLDDARRFRELGEDDSAIAAYTRVIDELDDALGANPKLTEAYMGMGDIFHRRGELPLAREHYENAARRDPNHYPSQYNHGLMLQLLGQAKDAVNAYLRALSLAPESFEVNRDIASAYLQLGDPDASLPYALRSTELNPDSQPAWSNLAAAYSLLGRFDNAIDAYRTANELGELADPVLLGLADAHIRLGNFPRAINTLNSLIIGNPSATAHERLGFALFKIRRYEDALEQFEQALQHDTEDLASLNGAGACYITLYLEGGRENAGQRDRAIECWRRSVQLQPEQTRIVDLLSRYTRV